MLHVANGHATTGLIELAGLPGRTMVWCDPLHDGPVPGDISDDELIRMRAEHLRWPGEALDDVVADLRAWRAAIRQQDYDELVLWYEHDLFDQLNLIQVLTHIRESVPARKTVSVICIGAFPGRPDFKGLGELTPEELGPLFETREAVTDEQYTALTKK